MDFRGRVLGFIIWEGVWKRNTVGVGDVILGFCWEGVFDRWVCLTREWGGLGALNLRCLGCGEDFESLLRTLAQDRMCCTRS